MKAIIIDDELPAIDELIYLLRDYDTVNIIGTFLNPLKAYNFIQNEKPDMVFIDIDMPEMGGVELALEIQGILPQIIIVFVTAYSQYAMEAFKAYPLDYILKPIDEERFTKTMQHITRRNMDEGENFCSNLSIKCFGKFEMTCGDEIVKFAINKARELLIFLICHIDQPVSRDCLLHMMFKSHDKKSANNLRVTLCRLRNTLAVYDIEKDDIFIKENCQLFMRSGICDYVDFYRFVSHHVTIDEDNVAEAERLIDLCNGELFCGLDESWLVEPREWVSVQIENVILKIVTYYMAHERFENAEKRLLYLLEINPLSEQGYLMLLDLYRGTSNIITFNLYFRKYAKMMEEELGSSADKRYKDFYDANK